jgi:hypothetical protein
MTPAEHQDPMASLIQRTSHEISWILRNRLSGDVPAVCACLGAILGAYAAASGQPDAAIETVVRVARGIVTGEFTSND